MTEHQPGNNIIPRSESDNHTLGYLIEDTSVDISQVEHGAPISTIDEAVAALAGIGNYVVSHPHPDDVRRLIASDPLHRKEILAGIRYLAGSLSAIDEASAAEPTEQNNAALAVLDDAGTRILSLRDGTGSHRGGIVLAGRALRRGALINNNNLDLARLPAITTFLPITDMFSEGDRSNNTGRYELYPALIAHVLKSVISDSYDDTQGALIDRLTNDQLVGMAVYCCIVNRYQRSYYNAANSQRDSQTSRLLMYFGGLSYEEMAAKESTAVRNPKTKLGLRTIVTHLRTENEVILNQVYELLENPAATIIVDDPLSGIRVHDGIIDALEIQLSPPDKQTPMQNIQLALRRYIAGRLIDASEIEDQYITNEVMVIWMRLSGQDELSISRHTGLDRSAQDDIIRRLHTAKPPALRSIGIPLRRNTNMILKTAIGSADNANILPESELKEQLTAPIQKPAAVASEVRETRSKDSLEINNLLFRKRIQEVIARGVLAVFIAHYELRAESQPRWLQNGKCKDDFEQIAEAVDYETTPQSFLRICIPCPVRELCLGIALSNVSLEKQNHADGLRYYYAGYTPKERFEMVDSNQITLQQIKQIKVQLKNRYNTVNGTT